MAYKHGIYVSEVPSSVRAAVKSDAGIQAIIGTAPVNLLKDPYHAANIPMLFYTMAEAQNAIGYSTDFKAYTICGSSSMCLTRTRQNTRTMCRRTWYR